MRTKLSFILILFIALFYLSPWTPTWTQAQDRKADGKPPPNCKTYELRLVYITLLPVAIRFNAETGESWIFPDGLEMKWAKIKDSKRIPAGNYEVVLSAAKEGKEGDKYAAFRIDRVTGTTWLLDPKEREWKEIAEPG
jgi:hypothetical protein